MFRRLALVTLLAAPLAHGAAPAHAAPQAQCHFAFLPNPGSNALPLVVTGEATAPPPPVALAIQLTCTVVNGHTGATYSATGQAPGPAVAVAGTTTMLAGPLTICAQVRVFWADGTQSAPAPYCRPPA